MSKTQYRMVRAEIDSELDYIGDTKSVTVRQARFKTNIASSNLFFAVVATLVADLDAGTMTPAHEALWDRVYGEGWHGDATRSTLSRRTYNVDELRADAAAGLGDMTTAERDAKYAGMLGPWT